MIVARVTKVANGKHRARPRPKAKSVHRPRSKSNPAHLLTLAFPNHKRRSTVKAAKKRKNGARRSSVTKRPATRMYKMKNKGHRRRGRKNPAFFGATVSPVRLGEYVLAGLIGVTVNRAILAALPATVTANNMYATIAALAIGVAQWMGGSMLSKDLGSAFGFGGLMNAVSTGLNAFIPQVGSVVSLSGLRDFVPATFTIPPQPAGIGGLSSYTN